MFVVEGHGLRGVLIDIGVGADSSEIVCIDDVKSHSSSSGDIAMPPIQGPFACDIPAGSRISCRAQSDTNNAGTRLIDAIVYLWG